MIAAASSWGLHSRQRAKHYTRTFPFYPPTGPPKHVSVPFYREENGGESRSNSLPKPTRWWSWELGLSPTLLPKLSATSPKSTSSSTEQKKTLQEAAWLLHRRLLLRLPPPQSPASHSLSSLLSLLCSLVSGVGAPSPTCLRSPSLPPHPSPRE